MDFCDALQNLIHGYVRMTREGWNGPGQWVCAQRPLIGSNLTAPYLYLKNKQNGTVPWVPSQGDIFADDWRVVVD